MKKLFYLIVLIVVLGLIVPGCLPVVPPSEDGELSDKARCATIQGGTIFDSAGELITTEYDKWGYNYQAHIFNGLYWNNSRPVIPWTKETLEAAGKSTTWLVMKWNDAWLSNKDCTGDALLDRHYGYESYIGSGAWCTNHQSGSYWLFDGTWELEFILDVDPPQTFPHIWEVTTQTDGTIAGIGESGIHDYTFVITVNGNSLEFTAIYGTTLPGYTYFAEGTIAVDGTISGTWVGSNGKSGTWSSVEGTAAFCEWDYFVKIVAAPSDATKVNGDWFTADGTEIGPVIWGQHAVIQRVYNDPCAGEEGVYDLSPCGPGLGKW